MSTPVERLEGEVAVLTEGLASLGQKVNELGAVNEHERKAYAEQTERVVSDLVDKRFDELLHGHAMLLEKLEHILHILERGQLIP